MPQYTSIVTMLVVLFYFFTGQGARPMSRSSALPISA